MDVKIIEKTPLTFPELAKVIQGLGKKEERSEIQNKILEQAKKSSKFKEDDAVKLVEEISDIDIPGLNSAHIVQIADIMPRDLSELKAVLAGSKATISPDNFNKIFEIVKNYRDATK